MQRQVGGSGGGETIPGPIDEPSGGAVGDGVWSPDDPSEVFFFLFLTTPATHTASQLPLRDPFISLTSQVPVSHKELYHPVC